MSQSAIDCCNSALQKVGAASITSFLDNSREARACNLAYDSSRRAELRKHYWNFATKRAVLAPDATAPAFDFSYQFTMPTDCLRVQLPNDPNLDWKIEGRKILTNYMQSPFGAGPNIGALGTVYVPPQGLGSSSSTTVSVQLFLKYIADIQDCTQWDPAFYDHMANVIALSICETLTQSNPKKQALMQDCKESLSAAKTADAFETLPADPPDDPWWVARL